MDYLDGLSIVRMCVSLLPNSVLDDYLSFVTSKASVISFSVFLITVPIYFINSFQQSVTKND